MNVVNCPMNQFGSSSGINPFHAYPRKFKRGIGSLFDPVLTLWSGGHIGSSRMEQSYCTSGFFRQRVTARNHSNYQPRPKRRSIIAYGKRENARHNKMRRSVCYVFSAVLRFPNFPGKGIAINFSRFVLFCFSNISMVLTCVIPKCIRSL